MAPYPLSLTLDPGPADKKLSMTIRKSHFEILCIVLVCNLGPEVAFSQSLLLKDLRPKLISSQATQNHSIAVTWEVYLGRQGPTRSHPDRYPASTPEPRGSVRDMLSRDDFKAATLKNQLAHMERDLNRSYELVDDLSSGQRLEVHLTPIQSKASLRYVGFGESELSYNPITESVLMVAQLKLDGGSHLVTQWMSGPLETSQQILWQWNF